MTRRRQSLKLASTTPPEQLSIAPPMAEGSEPPSGGWTLDRRIPVATLVVLGIQAFAWIWWAAGIDAQVTQNTLDIAAIRPVSERVTRIEALSEAQTASLQRIEQRLDDRE